MSDERTTDGKLVGRIEFGLTEKPIKGGLLRLGPPIVPHIPRLDARLDEFEKRLDALYHSFCELKEQVRKQSEEIAGLRANLGALFDADYRLGERIASLESLRDQWLAASSAEAVCPQGDEAPEADKF